MAVKSLAQSTVRQAPPVNSLLAGYSFQDFHHLETVQLGGAAASVTFSNLLQYSGEFRHLQIRATVQMSIGFAGVFGGNMLARINGDASTSYDTHMLYGNGSSVVSNYQGGLTGMQINRLPYANSRTDRFGGVVMDILDPFLTSKNTTARTFAGVPFAGDDPSWVVLSSGLWRNTAAVTSLTFLPSNLTTFFAGTRFSLYGIR